MSTIHAVPTIPSEPHRSTLIDGDDLLSLPAEERKSRTAELLDLACEATGAERESLLEQAIVINIPVARSLAARYRNRGQSQEELEQVACVALTRAVQSFNPKLAEDLLVFAVPTILGEIKRHFRSNSWAVRPPRRIQELRPQLAATEEDLSNKLGRPPTTTEIAEVLQVPLEEVEEAVSCGTLAHATSLDEPTQESGNPLAELLPALDAGFDNAEAVAMLGPACRKLKERDRSILRMRFYEQMTQQQIADKLGVTQVQVSRLLVRIFADLRKALESKGLPAHAVRIA